MKNKFQTLMVILFLAIAGQNLNAQPVKAPSAPAPPHPPKHNHNKEQMESMRITHYTRVMQLSPEEAKVFWPEFHKFQEEQKALRKKNPLKKSKGTEINVENMSEEDAGKFLKQIQEFNTQEQALQDKFTENVSNLLSRKKAVLFVLAEKDFRKELIRHVAEKRKE